MALVVLLAVFSFMPVMTIHTDTEDDFMKEYTEGYFTKDADVPSEINISVAGMISAIPSLSELSDLIGIQFAYAYMESEVESYAKQITSVSLSTDLTAEQKLQRITELREEITETKEEFNSELAKLGEADAENIKNLLREEDFRKDAATLYAVIGLLKWDKQDTADGKYPAEYPVAEMIAIAIFTVVIFLFAIISAVVFTVIAAVRLVKLILALIKKNWRTSEKLADGLPYGLFIAPILLSYAIIYYFAGDAVSLGSGVLYFIVTALVIGLIRIIDFCIYDCKSNMAIIHTVTKKAVTLFTLILALTFIFNFAGIGIYSEMTGTYEPYYEERYETLSEEYLDSGVDPEEVAEKASDNVESAGRLVYGYVPLIGIVMSAAIASATVERFGRCIKKENKKKKEGSSQLIAAVILIAVAVVPLYFSASSVTAMENSHRDGNFAVLYDEYLYEGTEEYEEYTTLKENIATAKTALDNNKDKMTSEEIVKANQVIRSGEEKLTKLETEREEEAGAALVIAIFIAILELIYPISNKILGKLAERAPERIKKKKPTAKIAKKATDSIEDEKALDEELSDQEFEDAEAEEEEPENLFEAIDEDDSVEEYEQLPEAEIVLDERESDEAEEIQPADEAVELVEDAGEPSPADGADAPDSESKEAEATDISENEKE